MASGITGSLASAPTVPQHQQKHRERFLFAGREREPGRRLRALRFDVAEVEASYARIARTDRSRCLPRQDRVLANVILARGCSRGGEEDERYHDDTTPNAHSLVSGDAVCMTDARMAAKFRSRGVRRARSCQFVLSGVKGSTTSGPPPSTRAAAGGRAWDGSKTSTPERAVTDRTTRPDSRVYSLCLRRCFPG